MTRQKKKDFAKIGALIDANIAALKQEYSDNVIVVPWSERWRYAIPSNYLNYQDGFLMPKCDAYRGMPMLNYNGETLYLRLLMEYYRITDGYCEEYLLYDRHGNKYTFAVKEMTKDEEAMKDNPSYWEFVPRVEKYVRRRAK